MSFMESAVLLAWVALVLLALGLAGLLRQVTVLSRGQAGQVAGTGATGGAGDPSRSTRDLVGFRLPADGELAGLVGTGAAPTVVVFAAPGCSSCALTLRGLAEVAEVRDGAVQLVAVSSGSCQTAEEDLAGAGRCVGQGRHLMDRLRVPATPYLVGLDDDGTIVGATLPGPGTDLADWVRRTFQPAARSEERG